MLLRVERMMSVGRSVGDVMIRRRVMRRAVGPIRDPLWNRMQGRDWPWLMVMISMAATPTTESYFCGHLIVASNRSRLSL